MTEENPMELRPQTHEYLKYLTPEEAAKLLFLTFRFSQGDEKLQRNIMLWIHDVFPKYRIRNETHGQLDDLATNMATKYIFKSPTPRHVPNINDGVKGFQEKDIREQITVWSTSFESILDGDNNDYLRTNEILDNITYSLLLRDHKYLVERGGRPNQNKKMESQVISHALNHRPTGSPEFDLMFSKISENILKLRNSMVDSLTYPSMISLLEAIEKVHENH
ncbi:MAG: hypothetical protein V4486_01325 [Patescibacteria group bacterium]